MAAGAALGVAAGPSVAVAVPRFPRPSSTSIVYVPHQDDEVLSFGLYIASQVASGNEVHVVLYTDGSRTGVCSPDPSNSVCRANEWDGRPVSEFVADRDAEFVASLTALGVPAANIHVGTPGITRAIDGMVTRPYAEQVIRSWVRRYPRATHVAYSWIDAHVDHRVGGQALRGLVQDGVLPASQALFALARWYWQYDYADLEDWLIPRRNELRTLGGYPLTVHMFKTNHRPTNAAYRDAIQAYRTPTNIGYRSTPLYLDTAETDPSSLLHGYESARYSTRMTTTAKRDATRTRLQVSGSIRFGAFPGFGNLRDPLGLAQALDPSLIADPLRGALLGIQILDRSRRLVHFTTTRVQSGGRYVSTMRLPPEAASVKVAFTGSDGAGPVSGTAAVTGP